MRLLTCLLIGCVNCLFVLLPTCNAQLPPAPHPPEIGNELRNEAILNLDSDDYSARNNAQQLLIQGSEQTVLALPEFIQQASLEGRIRALQIAQQINLKLLREQMVDTSLKVSDVLDEIRHIDDENMGHRIDEFRAIHFSLFERSTVRALTDLNAVIEFDHGDRAYPGLGAGRHKAEIPRNIFLGDNWLGAPEDLRYIAVILKFGQSNFGARLIYRIKGCPIALKDLQDFAAGLSGVAVGERSRARLGIGTRQFGFGWTVSDEMKPGSPAALAGIRGGDTVVRNQSKVVNTFNELVVSLNINEPGDEIELDIYNNQLPSQIIELTIPERLEDLGIEMDDEYLGFALIKSIKKGSVANQAGLTEMHSIHRVNNLPVFKTSDFELMMTDFSPGDKIKLLVRPLKRVTVRLRGWVGPYR